MIEVQITSWFPVLSLARNGRPVPPEELCSIALETAEILEGKYKIEEAYHYQALTVLVEALAKTLEFIRVAPVERIESNRGDWERRSAKAHAKYGELRKFFDLERDTVDLLTYEIAALFTRWEIDGFKAARVISELQYRLVDSYFDFLEVQIDGQPAKEFARSLQVAVETLRHPRPLKALQKNGKHP